MDSTVTAVPSSIRDVDAAAALTIDVGEERGMEAVWCSPKPKKSNPTSSATWTASSRFHMAWALGLTQVLVLPVRGV